MVTSPLFLGLTAAGVLLAVVGFAWALVEGGRAPDEAEIFNDE